MNKIHPLACVSPKAKLGDNVEVGPFAYIDENVEIGDGCKILPNAVIFSYVRMGKDCTVFPGAVVGAIPQDLKFDGEESWVEIGDRVNIRECVTINRGTAASGKALTKIGNDVLVMSYVHVAHDCNIGNHTILVSKVALAGRTECCFEGVNRVGLARRGFSEVEINEIKDIYETLYNKGMNVSDALSYIEENFPQTERRDNILRFIRASKRGIIRPPKR